MSQDNSEYDIFTGLMFWGSELLPQDMPISLGNIRKWADEIGIIDDAEFQFLASERIEELRPVFTKDDQLSILVHISKDAEDNLLYLEYPYLPVKALIKREQKIELVYWEIMPSFPRPGEEDIGYGEVRFGFYYPDINDELCSMSNAKKVIENFLTLHRDSSRDFEKEELASGVLTATVDGAIKAAFSKNGRYFDVEFS